jgi:hypothetical protein
MDKKNKGTAFWSKNLFYIFLMPILFCLFAFYGTENAKALPTLPATSGWVNVTVCTDTDSSNNVLLSNPFKPVIRWTPSGDGQSRYDLVVDNTYDTGIVGGGDTSFTLSPGQIDFDVPNHFYDVAISSPRGGGGWTTPWAHGNFTIPYNDGACPATALEFCAGTIVTTATPGLCNNTGGGMPANITGNSSGGPWQWDCLGVGGGSDALNCGAQIETPVSGCATIAQPCPGVTPSTSGLCRTGSTYSPGSLADAGDHWNWLCSDSCGGLGNCSVAKATPVVPSCGTDNGKVFCKTGEKPSSGLCNTGTSPTIFPTTIGKYEDWQWTCVGSCPSTPIDCSAKGQNSCGWIETN